MNKTFNKFVFSPFNYVCHEYSTGFKADLDFVKGNGLSELTPIVHLFEFSQRETLRNGLLLKSLFPSYNYLFKNTVFVNCFNQIILNKS